MNNTRILTKCIEALKGEKPDLSYVRGMLETLVEMQELPQIVDRDKQAVVLLNSGTSPTYTAPVPMDEGGMLDAKAKAALATMPPLQTE